MTSHRTRVRKRNGTTIAGFSMIELMLALTISSVLAAFSVPYVRSVLSSYRLRSAVSNVTWAVQSTRYQALMAGYPFQVTFSGGTGGVNPTYQIASEPIGTASFSNVGNSVPVSGSPVTLSATTTLQFKPNGSVTATTGGLSFNISYVGNTETIAVTNYGNVSVTP